MAIEASEGPPPHIRYHRALHLGAAVREFLDARQVMFSIAERDLRSRYSQMVLGFAWDIIGPVTLTIVIVFFLNRTSGTPTYGLPKPLFVYIGVLTWSFFQGSVASGGSSLVTNNALLNKVYAPREVFPIANIGETVVDTLCATSALLAIMLLDGRGPSWLTALWVPIPLLIVLMFTVAVTLVVAGLTVYFRDMRQGVPVVLQLGLFFNPIFFDLRVFSPHIRLLIAFLNPLAIGIDDIRRCLFLGLTPPLGLTSIAFVMAALELFIAFIVFKQMETGFADVA